MPVGTRLYNRGLSIFNHFAMKKVCVVLSAISLIASLSAFAVSYVRCTPMTADWMGILVGILSFLVTVLLGLQIVNYLVFKGEIKELMKASTDKMKEEIDLKISESSESLSHTVKAHFIYLTVPKMKGSPDHVYFDHCIRAIEEDNKGIRKDGLNELMKILKETMVRMETVDSYGNDDMKLCKGKRYLYLNILERTSHKDIQSVIDFIKRCKDSDRDNE